MSTLADDGVARHVRVGAAGAIGAATLLWASGVHAAVFAAGTVLLVVSLIPLARGLGSRGGAILGLLLSLLWIAARFGLAGHVAAATILSEANLIIVAAMMAIGALAGGLLTPTETVATRSPPTVGAQGAVVASSGSTGAPPVSEFELLWREALIRHREWMASWNHANSPWVSFDNHIRELVRLLTGMTRLRCYRVDSAGRIYPLSMDRAEATVEIPGRDQLEQIVAAGRPFLAGSAPAGTLGGQTPSADTSSLVWALPIRDQNAPIGIMTAEGSGHASEAQLQGIAVFVEELWLHAYHLDQLRTARQTDRGSGLINRTDFLAALKETLNECYRLHEPVVVVIVCLEGLRGLDDSSQWDKRDELIEAVGQAMAGSIRQDDMVGRFSDAQFVALLRRLDVPLGELICRKMLGSIAKVICEFELGTWITPRAGLSGSGFANPPAETLLRHAISSLQKARTQDMLLVSQLPDTPQVAGAT